jgi:uncharacterized membrane protein YraQ (UPF0718 family)
MFLVLLSIIALALGPGIVALAGARSWVLALIDGFVVVTIGGIALIHILPHALLSCGAWGFVAAAAGLVGPMLFERWHHGHDHHLSGDDGSKHRPTLALALLGIAMHAFLDGSAFAEHEGGGHGHAHGSELLGLAVVLHRVPEGLAIWWLVRPRPRGTKLAIFALGVVAVATVVGAQLGDGLAHGAGGALVAFLQAVVAGSLLHVVIHHAPPSSALQPLSLGAPARRHDAGTPLASAVGALAGVTLLFVVSASHPTAQRIAHEIAMGPTFLTLALESAPALLVTYVASAVVRALLPGDFASWLAKGDSFTSSLRALLVAPLLPSGSRPGVALYQTMLARGAPRPAALHAVVAAPGIGLATILLSWALLGGRITVIRGIAGVLTAITVGYGLARLGHRTPETDAPATLPSVPPPQPLRGRLWAGVRYGLGDMVDHTSPWIIVGLAVAAFAEPLLDAELVAGASPWFDVPAFAALGVPMYVCASGATPLVAVLLHKGMSPGAAIAFLLTGPATSLTTFGLLKRLHGKRLAAWFAAATVIVPTLLGWIINIGVPRDPPQALHTAAHEPATAIEMASLVLLGLLIAISLVRHGPRRMVAQLVASGAHEH